MSWADLAISVCLYTRKLVTQILRYRSEICTRLFLRKKLLIFWKRQYRTTRGYSCHTKLSLKTQSVYGEIILIIWQDIFTKFVTDNFSRQRYNCPNWSIMSNGCRLNWARKIFSHKIFFLKLYYCNSSFTVTAPQGVLAVEAVKSKRGK